MRTFWSSIALLVSVLAFSLLLVAIHSPVHAQAPVGVEAKTNGQESAAAQPGDLGYTLPVTGEPIGFEASGIFFGDLQVTRFEADGSTLLLIAVLDNYRYEEGGKTTIGNIRRDLALVITSMYGGCEGVAVVLEPLALGGEFPPEIMLRPIVLEDDAQSGSTKGVQELLCTVGRLAAKPNAPANALANLLNQVLRALSS